MDRQSGRVLAKPGRFFDQVGLFDPSHISSDWNQSGFPEGQFTNGNQEAAGQPSPALVADVGQLRGTIALELDLRKTFYRPRQMSQEIRTATEFVPENAIPDDPF